MALQDRNLSDTVRDLAPKSLLLFEGSPLDCFNCSLRLDNSALGISDTEHSYDVGSGRAYHDLAEHIEQ